MNILFILLTISLVNADATRRPPEGESRITRRAAETSSTVKIGEYYSNHPSGKEEISRIEALEGMTVSFPLTDSSIRMASKCISSGKLFGGSCDQEDFAKTTSTMMELRSLNVATRELDDKLKKYQEEHPGMRTGSPEKKYYDFAEAKKEYLISLNQKLLCEFPGSSYACPTDFKNKKTEYDRAKTSVASLEIAEDTFKELNVSLGEDAAGSKFLEQSMKYGFLCCEKEEPPKECLTEDNQDKCILGYGAYLASLTIAEGKEPLEFPMVVIPNSGEYCSFLGAIDENAISAIRNMVAAGLGLAFVNEAGEEGLISPKAAKYAAFSKALGGEAFMPGVGVYEQLATQDQTTVHPLFATQATGGTSLSMQGSIPNNPFTSASTGPTTTPAVGSGERTSTAGAVGTLNQITRSLSGIANASGSFNSGAGVLPALEAQNAGLSTSIIKVATPVPSRSGLERFIGELEGGSDAGIAATAEEEMARIQTGMATNTSLLASANAEYARCKAMAMFAGTKGMVNALQCMSDAQIQFALAESKLSTLKMEYLAYYNPYMRFSVYKNFIKYAFDEQAMYCDASSSNFKKVITPISYKEKQDWLKNARKTLKKLKLEIAKRKETINQARLEMKKILKERVPISSKLKKSPESYKIAYELSNMNVVRNSAKNNIKRIDKAMNYHKSKRSITPKKLYSDYQKEAASLRTAMTNVINAIDKTEPKLRRSLAIATRANLEVPRNEHLRKVAKEMVKRGY